MIVKIKNRVQYQVYKCDLCQKEFGYQEYTSKLHSDDVPPFCPECGKPWNAKAN